MTAIVELLNRLLALLAACIKRRRQRRAQEQRDALEDNPHDWFADHFDGVHKPDAADDGADRADQADADDPDKPR